jgi:hypothetical protein
MKTIISKAFALVAIAATLLSFTAGSPAGGEGFEIFVNGKVVLQRFNKEVEVVKTLNLDPASPNDKISFRYHHCGQVGKNRFVTIRSADNSPLKTWNYSDITTNDLSCTVKDLLSLQKGSNKTFRIFYSSSELPKGRELVEITFGDIAKR